MSVIASHPLAYALVGGFLGAVIGWLLRRVAEESQSHALRGPLEDEIARRGDEIDRRDLEIARREREVVTLRGRALEDATRQSAMENELRSTLDVLARSREELSAREARTRALESEIARMSREPPRPPQLGGDAALAAERLQQAEYAHKVTADELAAVCAQQQRLDDERKAAEGARVAAEREAERLRQVVSARERESRADIMELVKLRARTSEFEALVTEVRELEARLRAALYDRDATIASLQRRLEAQAAARAAPPH